MNKLVSSLALIAALSLPGAAFARPVTISAKLKPYGGDGAYLALYVTDAKGAYVGTLWVAGGKPKYYEHLSGWTRASAGKAKIDGITGASVGAGRTLNVTVDLADALFDAGYTLHVDAAVEDMRDAPRDASIALTNEGGGKPTAGKSYVATLSYRF